MTKESIKEKCEVLIFLSRFDLKNNIPNAISLHFSEGLFYGFCKSEFHLVVLIVIDSD